ncbi:MAG: hypothetical protein JO287_17940 [Pseudonocardiales bacterium]|nr:hypothetical protein [Pseudonocardiales bacterium]
MERVHQSVEAAGDILVERASVDFALDISARPLEQRLGEQLLAAREVAVRGPARLLR